MARYDDKFYEELLSKNEIVDVISKYVKLEQRGNKFFGRCPFHHEKTASFCVNQREQYFYCFGCKKAGNVIKFISEIESLDFADTIKFLADRAKIPLPDSPIDDKLLKEKRRERDRLYEILRETAMFYVKNIRSKEGEKYLTYARKRGLLLDTITHFGIGASLGYDGLGNYLLSKGYKKEEILKAGVCGENKAGKLYDFLAFRFIIPIIDQFGKVIAFTGRKLDDSLKGGKYVNTGETPLFSKRKNLFNLNNLKKLKNEKGLSGIIMVEGHMDVISLTQAGLVNVVASMGTAFTKEQARILKRYSEKVYICYDGDFAGQEATIKGLEIMADEGLDVKVVSLPDNMDPDEVVRAFGVEGYNKCLENALPLIDFKLENLLKIFNVNTIDGKRKFTSSAIRVIRESSSPAEQEDLLKRIREITGVSLEALKRELFSEQAPKEERTILHEFTESMGDKLKTASRFILYAYLFNKPYALEYDIRDLEFEHPSHKRFQKFVIENLETGVKCRFSDLYDSAVDEDGAELAYMAGLEVDETKNYDESIYFYDCIKTLKKHKIDGEIDRLNKEFKVADSVEQKRKIAEQLSRLIKEKKLF